jgi:hypothetical protein
METSETTVPLTWTFAFADGQELVVPLELALKFQLVVEQYEPDSDDTTMIVKPNYTKEDIILAIQYAEFDLQMEKKGVDITAPVPLPEDDPTGWMHPFQLEFMSKFPTYQSKEQMILTMNYLDYGNLLHYMLALCACDYRGKRETEVIRMTCSKYAVAGLGPRILELEQFVNRQREAEQDKKAKEKYEASLRANHN